MYKDKELTKEWNFETDVVTSEITKLYAKWEKRYLVTFYDEDCKSVLNTIYVKSNATVTEFTPTKTGYEFTGWIQGKEFKFSSEITANTYIIASWKKTSE